MLLQHTRLPLGTLLIQLAGLLVSKLIDEVNI